MSLRVQGISQNSMVSSVRNVNNANSVAFKSKKDIVDLEQDVLDLESKELSIEDKQKMVKAARVQAAGWALVGGPFSTLYYALRSDKKVAKKFNLDPEKDKKLIKQIKNEQAMWTLPGALLPLAGALIGYIVASNMNSKNIEIN